MDEVTKIEISDEGIIFIDRLTVDIGSFDYERCYSVYQIHFASYRGYCMLYTLYKEWLESIYDKETRYIKLKKLREEYWLNASYPIWNHYATKQTVKGLSQILDLSRKNVIKYFKLKVLN